MNALLILLVAGGAFGVVTLIGYIISKRFPTLDDDDYSPD